MPLRSLTTALIIDATLICGAHAVISAADNANSAVTNAAAITISVAVAYRAAYTINTTSIAQTASITTS